MYVAEERDYVAEERDYAAEERDYVAEEWDYAAEERDYAAEERDYVAEERVYVAEERDYAAEERDYVAEEWDYVAEERDYAAEEGGRLPRTQGAESTGMAVIQGQLPYQPPSDSRLSLCDLFAASSPEAFLRGHGSPVLVDASLGISNFTDEYSSATDSDDESASNTGMPLAEPREPTCSPTRRTHLANPFGTSSRSREQLTPPLTGRLCSVVARPCLCYDGGGGGLGTGAGAGGRGGSFPIQKQTSVPAFGADPHATRVCDLLFSRSISSHVRCFYTFFCMLFALSSRALLRLNAKSRVSDRC